MVIPKEAKAAIASFEKLKRDSPEFSEFADKRINQWHHRLEIIADPEKFRDEALKKIITILDVIEENMKDGKFIYGSDYTLACLLARLSAVNLLEDTLETRPKLSAWWNVVQGRPSFKSAGINKDPISIRTLFMKACVIL